MNTNLSGIGPFCLLVGICLFTQNGLAGEKRRTLENAMRTVENEKESYAAKRAAISFLKEQKAKKYIPRLGKVLLGKYDVVALDILNLFSDFADQAAWPHILAYEKRAEDDSVAFPGKINTALRAAKKACRPAK